MARKGTICKTLTLPDGTRKWVYGKTKKEVEEKLRELNHLAYLGVDVANTQTFGEFTKQWFEVYKKGKVRPTTERTYKSVINRALLPNLSGYRMKDIRTAHIQEFFNKQGDKAESTLKYMKMLLNMIFSCAVENGVVVRNPVTKSVDVGGHKTKKRTALTPQQVETMLTKLTRRDDYLVAFVALQTGMRIGELTGLMWGDIDWEQSRITVSRAIGYDRHGHIEMRDPKTERGYRTIPVKQECMDALRELKTRSHGLYVFTMRDGVSPMSHSYEQYSAQRMKKALGGDVHVSYHVLRHTYCTRLFEEGKLRIDEISYLMGHATISVTTDVYAHYLKESRLDDTASKIVSCA